MRTSVGRHSGTAPVGSLVGGVLSVILLFFCPLAPSIVVPSAAPPSLEAQEGRHEGSVGTAAIGGVVGGGVGFFTGLLIGASTDNCSDLCDNLAIGALIGETVGLAVGAHVLNGARGDLLADLGVSSAIMLVGVGLSSMDSGDEFILAAMVAQIIGVAITEVRTSPLIEPTTTLRRMPDGLALEVGVRIR